MHDFKQYINDKEIYKCYIKHSSSVWCFRLFMQLEYSETMHSGIDEVKNIMYFIHSSDSDMSNDK